MGQLTDKELLLVADLLNDASETYSNHGCNDFDFPSDWTDIEKQAFVVDFQIWNGGIDDDDDADNMADWCVMATLANKIRRSMKADRGEDPHG